MKQIIQNMQDGRTAIAEAPSPSVSSGAVLIQTTKTLISAGTERMLVEFGRSSLFSKARQQPEKVKQVLDKAKTDGVLSTLDAVRSKLAQPIPLGYCNVGKVIAVGKGVRGFSIGDRVASNGPHADIVCVPQNLCALIPDAVSDESAAFTVLSSIGLQGIRLAKPTLGESFVVTGVGLIGLLTVQLLKAHGCRVLAIDFDDNKLALAKQFGAQTCNPKTGMDPVAAGMEFSRGRGIDGVIITASTPSNDPVSQAAQMSRVRGRVILVGVTGLNLNRSDFYEKELSFQVSCSYGPGRYDNNYELRGNDYPFGLVRWTEQRNFEAVLDTMSIGKLNTEMLVSHRISFSDAVGAYDVLTNEQSVLGIILDYPDQALVTLTKREISIASPAARAANGASPVIGFIGAGNYASRVLIPAFKENGAILHTLVSAGGLTSRVQGETAGFEIASSDVDAMLSENEINTVVIATRHDSHASLVEQALRAGKHVFVEKPLALTLETLASLEKCWQETTEKHPSQILMVGFNRRFAPHVVKMKSLLAAVKEPKSFIMTVNAGAIPASHWTQDREIGGGRINGEACHFIDLMRFLAGSPIISQHLLQMGGVNRTEVLDDKATIALGFEDGSFGTIHYLANGSSSFAKERIEVFTAGRVLQIDNFRKLNGFGWPGFSRMNLWRQDKGQKVATKQFLDAIKTGTTGPISATELFEVTRVTIEAAGETLP